MVGDVPIGGGAQVAVQSMTNTMTYDVEATVQQVYDLNAAGADLVRVSVNGSRALNGFREVVWRSPVPLIADIHFDYRMALGAADAGAACVRINPGNVGSDDRYRRVIEKCQESGAAMRIGVNSGSVEKRFWDLPKTRGARGQRPAQGGDRRGDGLFRLQGLPQGEPRPRDGRGEQDIPASTPTRRCISASPRQARSCQEP